MLSSTPGRTRLRRDAGTDEGIGHDWLPAAGATSCPSVDTSTEPPPAGIRRGTGQVPACRWRRRPGAASESHGGGCPPTRRAVTGHSVRLHAHVQSGDHRLLHALVRGGLAPSCRRPGPRHWTVTAPRPARRSRRYRGCGGWCAGRHDEPILQVLRGWPIVWTGDESAAGSRCPGPRSTRTLRCAAQRGAVCPAAAWVATGLLRHSRIRPWSAGT